MNEILVLATWTMLLWDVASKARVKGYNLLPLPCPRSLKDMDLHGDTEVHSQIPSLSSKQHQILSAGSFRDRKCTLSPKMWWITLDPPRRLIHKAHLRHSARSWPRMRHLAEPTRWKVQVAAVYLALQRAVLQAERGPSTFPWQEVLLESLNNHQWSGLWFAASLDGKPSLTLCLLQLSPGCKCQHLSHYLLSLHVHIHHPHAEAWEKQEKFFKHRHNNTWASHPLWKLNFTSYGQSFPLFLCKFVVPWGSPHPPHPALRSTHISSHSNTELHHHQCSSPSCSWTGALPVHRIKIKNKILPPGQVKNAKIPPQRLFSSIPLGYLKSEILPRTWVEWVTQQIQLYWRKVPKSCFTGKPGYFQVRVCQDWGTEMIFFLTYSCY